ncbi:baseplate J/gp47 family protein [Bacillus pumilus]|uniref:baseplate J/gp47 family protein n=1 Tax=Bacillus pumilus TaxID=1408 RepID=UPI00227DF50F|nr:baseplate J/gp47 family protein [Bacillus pumilus]MCY7570937.1 baseplate J/gp47 family protein [Bacillus pumilus]MCY7575893.1 baseplate J/gp47 family protein [Bacillus pumilus]MEC3763234.1 baseplate J/gp47 family protein [Bacillus pumilus]
MFEEQSYEAIMERMLERIPDDIDKRENSVIWNALAPAAAELAQSYIWLDQVFDLVFADTAQGEFLDRRAAEVGITRKAATSAVWSVEVAPEGIRIPIGSRFYIDNLYFQYQDGTLKCETTGAVGNGNFAELPLLSLDNIPGLESVIFEELKIPGQEEEDDEALYERYLMRARREAVSANKAHYKKWAEEVEGVGRAKVFPLWNGEGTVKVVITDGNFDVATDLLVNKVQEYIDPVPGEGEGQAPIGATATVESAKWKDVEVSVSVELKMDYSIEDAQEEIEEKVKALLKSLAFEENVIRMSAINDILYHADSVSDYADVLINGEAKNLPLQDIEIPRLGQVIVNEQV